MSVDAESAGRWVDGEESGVGASPMAESGVRASIVVDSSVRASVVAESAVLVSVVEESTIAASLPGVSSVESSDPHDAAAREGPMVRTSRASFTRRHTAALSRRSLHVASRA